MTTPNFSTNLGAVTGAVKLNPSGVPLAGRVRSLYAVNRNVAVRYAQLYNQAGGAPAGAPIFQAIIKPSDDKLIGEDFFGSEEAFAGGQPFPLGIVFGVSTTAGSYVAATAAEHDVIIRYE